MKEIYEDSNPGMKVDPEAAIFMSGVLDYLTQEILVHSGNFVAYKGSSEKCVIKPKHITTTIEMDVEMREVKKIV